NSRVASVALESTVDFTQQLVKHLSRAGKVKACEVLIVQRRGHHSLRFAIDEIDDTVGETGCTQELHDEVRGEHRGGRRLPDDGISHQSRRGWKVPRDRREIKGRD